MWKFVLEKFIEISLSWLWKSINILLSHFESISRNINVRYFYPSDKASKRLFTKILNKLLNYFSDSCHGIRTNSCNCVVYNTIIMMII